MMKVAAAITIITALGLGGAFMTADPPPAPVAIQKEISPIEKARRATFLILFPKHNYASGTAVTVARKKLKDGSYRYRAITAYHVIHGVAKAIVKDAAKADRSLTIMLQPSFHGLPLRLKIKLDDIEWALPSHDWAAFTFDTTQKIECVQLATEAEFKAIGFEDNIYLVGAADRDAPHIRAGNIGATHNQNLNLERQLKQPWAWCKYPNAFFRPAINVWYGDSGGGIFNKDGKMIGIVIGYGMVDQYRRPVTHSTIALKAHIILEMTKHSKDFFLVED
jgi:hypothetical protein